MKRAKFLFRSERILITDGTNVTTTGFSILTLRFSFVFFVPFVVQAFSDSA